MTAPGVDPRREKVARALWDAVNGEGTGLPWGQAGWSEVTREVICDRFRRLADAAINAIDEDEAAE